MTDVRLFHTDDGGEIECVAGQLVMDEGLETAVYLSLFGGNVDDSGNEGEDSKTWWGNLSEVNAENQYRSQTQFLLKSIPATSSNMLRIEDAITRDLAWMVDTKLASVVHADVSIPALNAVKMDITIVINGEPYVMSLSKKWGAS